MDINYRSPIDFTIDLYDAGGRRIGWPDWDWHAIVHSGLKANAAAFSRSGETLVNCMEYGDRIRVIVPRHNLTPGPVTVELTALIPDPLFPGGIREVPVRFRTGISLVSSPALCPAPALPDPGSSSPSSPVDCDCGCARCSEPSWGEVNACFPGFKGDPFTYSDFTEEQKEELRRPVAEETERLLSGKQDALSVSEDLRLSPDGELSLADEARMKVFIDLWNTACRYTMDSEAHEFTAGRYNEETGFFELNGITDITYDQALIIMSESPVWVASGSWNSYSCAFTASKARTVLPVNGKSNYGIGLSSCFHQSAVEVVDIPGAKISGTMDCACLHTLRVSVIADECTRTMPELVDFAYHRYPWPRPRNSKSFELSSRLSLQSLKNLVEGEAAGTDPVTITVHPDVYARLTDTGNAEWNKVLTDAAAKKISFATV